MKHFLVVHELDLDRADDWCEVEHPDNCSMIDRGGYLDRNCGVAHYEREEGIDNYWRHVDDDDVFAAWLEPLAPGRYEIEVWHQRHPSGPWGAEEWSGGLRLVD